MNKKELMEYCESRKQDAIRRIEEIESDPNNTEIEKEVLKNYHDGRYDAFNMISKLLGGQE